MDENIEKSLADLTARIAHNPITQAKLAHDEAEWQLVRSRTRGAIIAAHHDLDPREWTAADDRMLDLVTAWLDNLKER